MPFKIVRNDITKMNTEAIVNTANDHVSVGTGCDSAVYKAAGADALLKYREENIGYVPEGDAFITPGFKLQAKYIILLCNLQAFSVTGAKLFFLSQITTHIKWAHCMNDIFCL